MVGQDFLISDFDVGLEKDKEPFLLPEKAFPILDDAFIFRGRVQKRFGFANNGRLRRVFTASSLGNSGASPWAIDTYTLLGITETNAELQRGSITITIQAGPDIIFTDTVTQDGTLTSPTGGNSGVVNYVTGIVTLTHTAGAGVATIITVSYFPTLPVMGLRTREISIINQEQTIAFDTTYAYRFTGSPGQWNELPSTLATTWNGTDSDFFWTTNYFRDATNNILFWETNNIQGLHGFAVTLFGGAVAGPPSTVDVTAAGNTFQVGDTVYFLNLAGAAAANNVTSGVVTVAGDPLFTISNTGTNIFVNGAVTGLVLSGQVDTNGDGIKYYNGTTWTNFNPAVNQTTALMGCKILIPFRNRLLALNTLEGNSLAPTSTNFRQRLRFSQNRSPLTLNLSWRDDIVGRGGFEDAATAEAIVSTQFVKDRLIVFFEQSTWEIVYRGDELRPFVWQRINSELGAESTFSEVPFDDGVLGIGDRGIHVANSNGVERIDIKIPEQVGQINNTNDGPARVYGIRDYFKELVYWTFPSHGGNPTYPNKVLAYNYRNNTFAIFNDRFTCYGYFQKTTDVTWADLSDKTWATYGKTWNAGVSQAFFEQIIAGNSQGFTQLFDYSISNDAFFTVTAITGGTVTSPNHGILSTQLDNDGVFIRFQNLTGITIGPIAPNTTQTFKIQSIIDADNFTIDGNATGTYPGGGTFEILNNINITTKNFDFFTNIGKNNLLNKIDFLFDNAEEGEVTLELFKNTNTSQPLEPLWGTKVIITGPENDEIFSESQSKIWHNVYRPLIGESFQLQIRLTDDQMRDVEIQSSDIVLHAISLNVEPTGDLG